MAPEGVEELSDEQMDKQGELKQAANDLLEDGKSEEALAKMTEAICIGAASAMMYAKRAQLLMQLDRPKAAINDCTAALSANPDSAKAMKVRARAYVKLEKWEEAHADFQTALKIDYDEDTEDASKEAEKKAKEIKSEQVKQRNKDEEAEYQRKLKESKEAYEAGLKAREDEHQEAKEKKEAEKRKAEEERRERVRKREQESAEADKPQESDGAPKSYAPGGAGAEDVD